MNGSATASVPVDPVAQMRSIIAAETEKCLNSMKELLAKQVLNKENIHNGSHPNGQPWNGNPNDQWGNQRGQGRHNASGQVQCYNCQGYGYIAKECQTQGYLKVEDNRLQYHLSKNSMPMPRILYQCNILSQFHTQ